MSKRTLKDAKKAIEALFSDTSVSQKTTLAELEELQAEIETSIDAIKVDIRKALK